MDVSSYDNKAKGAHTTGKYGVFSAILAIILDVTKDDLIMSGNFYLCNVYFVPFVSDVHWNEY